MQKIIQDFVRERKWIHVSLGLVGNVCFFVGSILFLSETLQPIGTWLFIVGSAGMLIDSIGNAILLSLDKE
jgi:hypothetical protein